jgi:hypothetical protein
LRIHDNPVLNWAIDKAKKEKDAEIVPVYCMGTICDPRIENTHSTRKEGI